MGLATSPIVRTGLGPPAHNGGPTETTCIGAIPYKTAATLNGKTVKLCPTTDQRGMPSDSSRVSCRGEPLHHACIGVERGEGIAVAKSPGPQQEPLSSQRRRHGQQPILPCELSSPRHRSSGYADRNPRTSRPLCGSLAFKARMRRGRSTVAWRLVREARCRHGRSSRQGARAAHGMHRCQEEEAGDDARCGHSSGAILTIAPCFAERSRYGTRTPNRLATFTSSALTTSGSDHFKAMIFR